MIRAIRRVGQGAYWWIVRRYNNLKDRLGLSSYPDLKEFVYLDETALISLLSSTTGGITQQQTTSQRQRISSSITGSLGPIGSSVGSEKTRSKETVQKYVIQSNFKELYEIRKSDLAVSDHAETKPRPNLITAKENDDVEPFLQEYSSEPERISRSDLIELDATLRSSEIYEYFQVFDAFEDIVESFSTEEEFQKQLREQGVSTDQIAMILELMDVLMAGLVPIECKSSNYGVSENNKNVIVDKDWANENGVEFRDLYLAGFIDEDNLWQEPTRILFGEGEFTIYGRLDSPSPRQDWSPLKLINILKSVFPDVAQNIEDIPDLFNEVDSPNSINSNNFKDTIQEYLQTLETQSDGGFPDGAIEEAINTFEEPIEVESYGEREDKLQSAEESLDRTLPGDGLDDYFEDIPRMRADFLEDQAGGLADANNIISSEENEKYYLETNFIAIYW